MRKFFSLGIIAFALHAQSLHELEQYALEHAIEIQKTKLESDIAEAKKKQKTHQQYGKIDLVGSYNHYNTSRTYKPLTPQIIASREYVYTTKDLYSVGVSYDVALFTGFAQTQDIAIADLSSKIAQLKQKLTKEQLLYNIRSLYLAILAQKEMLVAQEEYIRALEKLHQQIVYEVDLGKKAKIDLLKSQADIQKAILQKEEFISNIAITKATLSELVTLDVKDVEDINIEVTPMKESIDTLLAKIESLSQVQLDEMMIQKAQKGVKKLHSKNLPQVMLNGYYGYNFGEDEILGTWENENLWQVGVNLKWNIIDFGVTSAMIQEAKVSQLQANISKQKTLLHLKKQLIEAKSNIDLEVAQYNGNKTEWELAKESANIEEVRYQNNAATLNDLLLAKSKAQLAHAKMIQSKYNYQKALYFLAYILEKGQKSEK